MAHEIKTPRIRVFGEDLPFTAWMRNNPKLPVFAPNLGFVASDVDVCIHTYKKSVDSVGTRELQCIADLEVKSRNGEPRSSQADTLFKKHKLMRRDIRWNGQVIRGYGVSFVSLSHTTPKDSEIIRWGRFDPGKDSPDSIVWRKVKVKTLESLMRFELDPDTLRPIDYRRHHKTSNMTVIETTELGLKVPAFVTTRS